MTTKFIKRAWDDKDTALTIGGTSLAGTGAYLLKHRHLRDFNPFAEKRIKVIGGVKDWDPALRAEATQVFKDVAAGKSVPTEKLEAAKKVFMLDSFSGQTLASADALNRAGLKVDVIKRSINSPYKTVADATKLIDPKDLSKKEFKRLLKDKGLRDLKYFDLKDFYRTPDLSPKQLRGADAILQLGDSTHDMTLAQARKRGAKLYRMLTDYGDGNFKQPDYWLGQNWMKVRDPKIYDRLIVPGGAENGLWDQLGRGRSSNINVDRIGVSPIFGLEEFRHTSGSRPKAMFTLGGGANGWVIGNPNVKEINKYNFIGKERTLFDDMLSALRAKHGNKATLDAYLGSVVQKKQFILDPATGKLKVGYAPSDLRLSVKMRRLMDSMDPNSRLYKRLSQTSKGKRVLKYIANRYKGLNLIGQVPQSDIAKAYATSDYIFALPGSTAAEFAAIKGQKHGNMIHLIPSEADWSTRHFRGNAKFTNRIMQPNAKKNIVDLLSKNRASDLTKAVREGGFKDWGRKAIPQGDNLAPMAKAIKRDIILKRLGRVGKLGLLATPAVGAGAYLYKKHTDKKAPPKSRMQEIWNLITDKVSSTGTSIADFFQTK